jgi:dienelactone hydrolase
MKASICAVVVLHGCGGFGTPMPVATEVLKSFGYVALAIDSLGEENACTPGSNGSLAEAFDAYVALDWLAQQNSVDPDRVAVLGYSMGGIAALKSVEAGVGALEKAEKHHFRAAVAYYPCTRYGEGVMTVPTLILVGDKEDWTPASYCQKMMARRNGKGAPVTLIVYPGAMHAFNIPFEPPLYFGHHLAYDPQATAEGWKEVRDFLHRTLGGTQPAGNEPPSGSAAESR